MGEVLALSAWLGLEALHGGPSIAGRGLDAQTGDPVAGAAIVIDGRTAAAAGADGVLSACRFDAPGRRTRHRGARGQPRSPDGASVDRVHCLVHVESTLLTSRGPANTAAVCGKGSPSRRPSVCRFSSDY
jgi:hypothetical protein